VNERDVMSFRPVPPDPVATPRAGSNAPASMDRLRAVLQIGTTLAPKMDGVSTDAKRQRDGSFVLSPEEMQIILETDDVEDVPLLLREAYKTITHPTLVKGGRRYETKTYLLRTDRLKRVYLRYRAVKAFQYHSSERFYDDAAQGMYGDVNEGDWEAAGITMEASEELKFADELLDPLQKQWDRLEESWKSQGSNYVLEEGDDASDFEERFEKTYNEHMEAYNHGGRDLNVLEKVINDFVDSMVEPTSS
jgi:hypothetical protein